MVRLSVNIDHVATLRQARGTDYPDPAEAAMIAESAGAHGITVHLRSDRRHIQDADVERLASTVQGRLNLEMAATEEMLAIAERVRPAQVTLVPERPEELTTEGGLNVQHHLDLLRRAAARLQAADIDVSLFLDPDPEQIDAAARLSDVGVTGFEINTDHYTRSRSTERAAALSACEQAAAHGAALGLGVYAGHGLTNDNVGPVARIPEVTELNIGHFLISRSVAIGLTAAVREMLTAMGSR